VAKLWNSYVTATLVSVLSRADEMKAHERVLHVRMKITSQINVGLR